MWEPQDTAITDHLEEKEALQLAKDEGIEFVDYYRIEGLIDRFETKKEAEAHKKKEKLPGDILQVRERKS